MKSRFGFFVVVLATSAVAFGAAAKPAERAFKNVQIFKGLPASELNDAMDFMAGSLGVRCGFCHVRNEAGSWEMWKDDLPQKKTARAMIRMTREINRANFQSHQVVTCATCHRGHSMPVGEPPLFDASSRPAHPITPPAEARKLSEILKSYAESVGSADAFGKIKTLVATGAIEDGDGHSSPITIERGSPDRLCVITTRGDNRIERTFDGNIGWVKNSRGISDLAGSDLEELRQRADFWKTGDLAARFGTMAAVDVIEIDGRPADHVVARRANGPKTNLYFDRQSGLLVRETSAEQTPLGNFPQEEDYSDYRDVEGVKVPFVIVSRSPQGSNTERIAEVKVNVELPGDAFTRPGS